MTEDSSNHAIMCGLWPNSCFVRDSLASWERFGKSNLIAQMKKIPWETSLEILFDLLIRIIREEELKKDYFSKIIKEINDALKPTTLSDDLADIFSFIDNEVSESAQRKRFDDIVKECVNDKHVLQETLQERLNIETLVRMEYAQSNVAPRMIKLKTRLFYKQQKFNLLREESEGFCKLITELAQFALFVERFPDNSGLAHPHFAERVVLCRERILILIGYFDLDPNRVLALILDVFSSRLARAPPTALPNLRRGMLALLREYGVSQADVTHTVGQRFCLHTSGQPISEDLCLLTAVLVQSGSVDLYHLYPYFEPGEKDIEAFHANFATAKSIHNAVPSLATNTKNIPATLNAPATNNVREAAAPPLVVLAPSTSTTTVISEQEWLSKCQSLGVARALIAIGDWRKAEMILNRWPGHLATCFVPLANTICDYLRVCISSYYTEVCPVPSMQLGSTVAANKHHLPTASKLSRQRLRHLQSIPQSMIVKNMKDFRTVVLPVCSMLGPNLHYDPILLTKLCRIGKAHFEQRANENGGNVSQPIDQNYQGLFNLLDECILPALTLCNAGCPLAEEVWELLKWYPYEFRYRLYGQWHENISTGLPKLQLVGKQCASETKYILKRLSKENVRKYGRQLGKLSHSCPSVVFQQTIPTIQLQNLANYVSDAFKFLSTLSGDVLAYYLVFIMASDKKKLVDNQLSLGFQELARFTAIMAKKYHIDLSGVLHYVFHQMCSGVSYDLRLLREIMHQMTGIEVSVQSTPEQLEAMCGGELLRHEAGTYQQIRNTRRNSQRLRETLISENLALPLVFTLAHRRESILYENGQDQTVSRDPYEQSMRLKIDGILFDECQETLLQFTTFLSLQLSVEELQRYCSSLTELVRSFHLPLDVAFSLLRNIYQFQIQDNFKRQLDMHVASTPAGKLDEKLKIELFIDACNHVYEPVMLQVKELFDPLVWKYLTPRFVTVFWSLQSSDIEVPTAAYARQITSCEEQMKRLASLTDARRRREEERLQLLISKLKEEEIRCTEHVRYVLDRLKRDCSQWFVEDTTTTILLSEENMFSVSQSSGEAIMEFVSRIIPMRVLSSQLDAHFCAKFALLTLQLRVPRFSLLMFLDKLFEDISLHLMTCTENEAARFGHFMAIFLHQLHRWHYNPKEFLAHCKDNPCFHFHRNNPEDQFELFRHIHHKWHYRLTKSFVPCTESKNYIQIRNSLLVLTRMLPYYPHVVQFARAIDKRIDALCDPTEHKRKDIVALAKSYRAKRKGTNLTLVPEHEFHAISTKKDEGGGGSSHSVSTTTSSGGLGGNINIKTTFASSSVSANTTTTTTTTAAASSNSQTLSNGGSNKAAVTVASGTQVESHSMKSSSTTQSSGGNAGAGTLTSSTGGSSAKGGGAEEAAGKKDEASSSGRRSTGSDRRPITQSRSTGQTYAAEPKRPRGDPSSSNSAVANVNESSVRSSNSDVRGSGARKERNSPTVAGNTQPYSGGSSSSKATKKRPESAQEASNTDDSQATSRKVLRANSQDSGSGSNDGRRTSNSKRVPDTDRHSHHSSYSNTNRQQRTVRESSRMAAADASRAHSNRRP